MGGLMLLLVCAIAFVGTHFILSHPLRRPLVNAAGEKGFLAVYSIVAFATLGAMVWAYLGSPQTAVLWNAGDGLWGLATLLMLIASVMMVGSLIRNPALPMAGNASTAQARGVFGVTRHPMMWAFAIWGVAHILVYPVAKNIIVAVAIIVLALAGAALQDRKKAKLDPQAWSDWERRTSYWPFAAIIQGRTRFGNFGALVLVGGLVLWLLATWAHIPLTGWRAGIWRWLL